ncbi:RES family NAD+ phosphorylase [Synechococcus sp. CS-1328]|uniref:RES family NAD+ phosphorylase n=1 Tax=Synechococcus sp. CS-1328 TaxID=2847976 RepID=UPI002880BB10|nr:RES family NAD+ phosphorylase [Synechococcus sp. CS-1328]MCT0224750.1 RES family NAD+ phosphorylase [Synechococcus sp. CS-1328]
MDLILLVQDAPEVLLTGTVLRLVQQQGIDTLGPLVDDLDQLARLEALVETSKPPLHSFPTSASSHPLLTTPFRYPPLRHGSRFGGRESRGMFYGSRSRAGSLVEGAYYALLFWEGMQQPPPTSIRRRQTLFSVLIDTSHGLQLQTLADDTAQSTLQDPRQYGPSQRLGQWMREAGIEAFEYLSARSREPLLQVGLFTPSAMTSTPFDQVEITCEINSDHASFLSHDDGMVHRFSRELFLVDGELPQAAA